MKKRWAVAAVVLLLVAGGAARAQDEVSWSNLVARLEELQKEMAALIAKAFGESGQTGGGTARGRGRNGRPVSRAGGRAARRRPQRLRSSTRISLATAFSVSKTPIPVVATASKVGSRL